MNFLNNRVFNVNSEISNLDGVIQYAFNNYDNSDDYIHSLGYLDIDDIDDLQNIMDQAALHEFRETDETDETDFIADFWGDGVMQLERINKNSNLAAWLSNWFGHDETIMQKNIRGFYETENAFYWVHGIGYDALSADLLGGSADGLALDAFYKFINNKLDDKATAVHDAIFRGKYQGFKYYTKSEIDNLDNISIKYDRLPLLDNSALKDVFNILGSNDYKALKDRLNHSFIYDTVNNFLERANDPENRKRYPLTCKKIVRDIKFNYGLDSTQLIKVPSFASSLDYVLDNIQEY